MPGTVTVACKLPNGLELRVFDLVPCEERDMSGTVHKFTRSVPKPKTVIVKGNSFAQGASPDSQILGGYALTPGVDKDFWDLWLKQNAELPAVANGLIFADEKSANTDAQAREKRDLKSGLERLDPKALPKGSGIEKAA